ncbi:MAG TPA: hypothetical protein VFE13_16175, partial [Caulobacteraceae bacterium]|nr:hypothetical protein [Caulobacteraceae bacterium]
MIRGLFSGIAALALMSGAAIAQDDSYSRTTTTTVTRDADVDDYGPPPAATDPRYDRDTAYSEGYREGRRDGYYDREGYWHAYDRYHRPYVYDDHDPGAHALAGGAGGAAAGAAIGCLVTIPIGCAPGAAIGAAVG